MRLLTHDSFLLSDGVLDAFTEETGIEVEVIQGGDAGTVVNQAILTNGNPQADVLFGIDSTFLSRALDERPVRRPTRRRASTRSTRRSASTPTHCVTPIDYGDVCLNYDKAYFEEHDLPVPTSLDDLTDPAYADLPRGREPGDLVAGPGVPPGQRRGLRRGRVGGVVERPARQRRAGGRRLGGGLLLVVLRRRWASEGDRPLVVSYASSPPAEVLYADPPVDEAPDGRDRRQLLPAGGGRRHPRRHRARAGGAAS